jgi:RNA polymerase sigma factor (sigma-70 family)
MTDTGLVTRHGPRPTPATTRRRWRAGCADRPASRTRRRLASSFIAGTATNTSGVAPACARSRVPTARGHFAAAAEAIRRILVDQARRKQAVKRGGQHEREELDPGRIAALVPDDELLVLHETLDQFAEQHPEKAELVKFRYFAGLTADEAAAALGISPNTADRHWHYARAWIRRAMSGSSHGGAGM